MLVLTLSEGAVISARTTAMSAAISSAMPSAVRYDTPFSTTSRMKPNSDSSTV